LEHLFSSSPGNPWKNTLFPDTTLRNEFGHVTLQGFLAQWSMQTLLDHKVTLSYLAYLGYPNETTSALKSCRKKQFNLKKCARSVFLCLVVGATGSGKTSLLKSHLGRPFESTYTGTQEPLAVVNTVEIGGVEKYLVVKFM
jgi:Ras family protein T1